MTGTLAAEKGSYVDGTVFRYNNIETVSKELKELGYHPYGYRRMLNGTTGEFIDTKIFMGPTYYQRLQKFVADQVYAVSRGPTDAMTRQPLDGKALMGGMRLGDSNPCPQWNVKILLVCVWQATCSLSGNILQPNLFLEINWYHLSNSLENGEASNTNLNEKSFEGLRENLREL